MQLIERPDQRWDYAFRILVGGRAIPGGSETPGSLTPLDAVGRCLTMAQQRIDYFLSQHDLSYWQNTSAFGT